MAVSATGVWLDMATGQVVTVRPVNGIQVVAPGGVIDANAARVQARAELEVTNSGRCQL